MLWHDIVINRTAFRHGWVCVEPVAWVKGSDCESPFSGANAAPLPRRFYPTSRVLVHALKRQRSVDDAGKAKVVDPVSGSFGLCVVSGVAAAEVEVGVLDLAHRLRSFELDGGDGGLSLGRHAAKPVATRVCEL